MKEITKIESSTDTYKINKNLKLNTVNEGEPTDNVLVHGSDNEVKSIPRSEFGGGIVDLDYSATPTGGTVFSSSGNDAIVPLATTVNAGLLSPEEKVKLEGFTVTPDATLSVKGRLKLAGDLGGTADLPTTPTAIHKTGNETKSGILSFTNTGVDQTNGIRLTNNGTSYGGVLKVDNNASAYGVWITNTSTGLGALLMNNSSGTGIRSENTSTGIGIYSYNLRDGVGFSSDNFSSGVGVKLNSNNDSTGDLLNIMKNGVLTGKIDHLGKITSPSFIKSDGMSNQFLKADGSIDSNTYASSSSPNFIGIPSAPTASKGTNTTQLATTAFVLENSRPYKVYTALLSQTGTDVPNVAILENTIGGIVWTRLYKGVYTGSLTGAFTSLKTFCTVTNGKVAISFLSFASTNSNTVMLGTYDFTGNAADGLLDFASVEIRVYP
jgi:hypothetical protein